MDSHDAETFSMDNGTIDDENAVQEIETAEKPSKKWMGKFSTPEELEVQAFKLAHEKNELERKLRDREPAQEVIDPEIQSAYDKTYKEEYEDLYEEALEEYGSRENIPEKRMNNIQRKAKRVAQDQGDKIFLFKEVQRAKHEMRNDPETDAVRELINNHPELSRMKNDPRVWDIGKKFLESASQIQRSSPAPRREQPKYASTQSSRAVETDDKAKTYQKIGYSFFGDEFAKYDTYGRKK